MCCLFNYCRFEAETGSTEVYESKYSVLIWDDVRYKWESFIYAFAENK